MSPQSLEIEFPKPESRERTRHEVTHGAKLICINDKNLHRNYSPGPVVEGQIYCVRELYTQGGVPGVLLVGIVGPFDFGGLECGFLLSRFRWIHD